MVYLSKPLVSITRPERSRWKTRRPYLVVEFSSFQLSCVRKIKKKKATVLVPNLVPISSKHMASFTWKFIPCISKLKTDLWSENTAEEICDQFNSLSSVNPLLRHEIDDDACISIANSPSFLVWHLAPAQLPLMESERHTVEEHINNWRLFV